MKSIKYLILTLAAILVSVMSAASVPYVAPGKPVAKSPSGGQVITGYTPTLTWVGSVPATGTTILGYQVQIAQSNDFSYKSVKYPADPPTDPTKYIKGTTFTLPTLEYGATYYWRVQGFNNLKEPSGWSNVAVFRTAVKTPIPTDPDDGDTSANNPNLRTLRPTFQWTGFSGSQSFTLQVAKECDFLTSVILNVEVSGRQFTPSADLPANTRLCWRVRANNSTHGSSDWSKVNRFLTANPPSIPVLTDPVDKTLTNDNSPRLVWVTVSLPAGTSFGQYEVKIVDDDKNFSYERNVSVSVHDHAYYDIPDETQPAPDMLPGAHTYLWKVRACNSKEECSVWSSIRTLYITVDSPINLKITPAPPTDPRPLFVWDSVYAAEAYHITIMTAGVGDPIVDITYRPKIQLPPKKQIQYRPSVDLPSGATIYWWVKAIDIVNILDGIKGPLYGTSLDSDVNTFTSANSPSMPVLMKPALKAVISDTTPKFVWSDSFFPAGATFDHYEFKIAENARFTINVVSRNETFNSLTLGSPLTVGKTYYWTVRTCNAISLPDYPVTQCSSWSPAYSFQIK
jgi:hypothetical protein